MTKNFVIQRFWRDERGGIAVLAGIGVPVLALLAAGAIDLAAVAATKSNAQALADAASLQAARQIGVADPAGIPDRTAAWVQSQAAQTEVSLTYSVATVVDSNAGTVKVTLTGNRPSFFMNLLPPGGWNIHAESTAAAMAKQPLCVLSTGTNSNWKLITKDSAFLSAPKCLIQGNSEIRAEGLSSLSAGAVQSVGNAFGSITPTAQTGAAVVPDPFMDMSITPDSKVCNPLDILNNISPLVGIIDVPPGVHCGNIIVGSGKTLNFQPGEHYFKFGKLEIKQDAKITGTNVVFIFDKDSTFIFKDQGQVHLKGRKTGAFSGFVLATTRENTNTFEISSDSAREMLGTIYIPQARLQVSGSNNTIADQSAWTVIVAQSIEMIGSAKLQINANYDGSGVPVPNGVGPYHAGLKITK